MDIRALLTAGCVIAAFLGAGGYLHGDLEYCFGIDALIADSPLVVSDRVNAVTVMKNSGDERIPPSKAEISILEVIKGEYQGNNLTVYSGPLTASAAYPVHYSFKQDETYVFIFPDKPSKGSVHLKWGGSLLRAALIPVVRSRILRSVEFRNRYLENILSEHPEIYDRGLRLAGALETMQLTWPPEPEKGEQTPLELRPYIAAVANLLADCPADALYAAYASVWLDPDRGTWKNRTVWKHTITRYEKYRRNELLIFNREQIGQALKNTGVSVREAREYIASIPSEELQVFIPFPFEATESFSHKRTGEILTTELIFQFLCYDQVGMYTDYLKDFDLSSVNPARIEFMIPYLFSSGIKELNVIANKLIREIPGNHFTGFIFRELVTGNTDAWYALKNWDNEKMTEERLSHLLNLGEDDPYFWKALMKGECFEKSVVKRALRIFGDLGKPESRDFKDLPLNARDRLKKAVALYLGVAREILTPEIRELPEYKEWYEKTVR